MTRFTPWQLAAVTPLLCLCSALQITLAPWKTDRPGPGDIVFFETTREMGDPQFVDVILRNNEQGNSTSVFDRYDIVKDGNAGFKVPFVPPGKQYVVRMVDASTKRLLIDSESFEIFSVGIIGSVTTSRTPPTSSPPSTAVSSSQPVTSDRQASPINTKKAPPIGAIVGGLVGGLAILIACAITYLCLRRRPTGSHPHIVNPFEAKNVVSPFIIPPLSAGAGAGVGSGSERTTTFQPSASYRNEKARYHRPRRHPSSSSKFAVGGTSSLSKHRQSSPYFRGSTKVKLQRNASQSTAAARAEELRRERERIDREIAVLEWQASPVSSRVPAHHHRDEVEVQLEVQRGHVRRMEDSQQHMSRVDSEEPTPEYVPSRR